MRSARLWAGLLGVERAVVERVGLDEDEQALVVSVRPRKGAKRRCGRCGRRCPGFDQGEGRRRWRALDLGVVRAYLEAGAPRVCCPEHGVVVAQVPWARHGAGHTRGFDDTAAWLVFALKGVRATVLLEAWLAWARRCCIPAFVGLAKAIARHRAAIQAALTQGLSNGRVEAVNTKVRLLTRIALGFKSPEALTALAMLSLGGLCPPLPDRG